jgi:hypothetical protein
MVLLNSAVQPSLFLTFTSEQLAITDSGFSITTCAAGKLRLCGNDGANATRRDEWVCFCRKQMI